MSDEAPRRLMIGGSFFIDPAHFPRGGTEAPCPERGVSRCGNFPDAWCARCELRGAVPALPAPQSNPDAAR